MAKYLLCVCVCATESSTARVNVKCDLYGAAMWLHYALNTIEHILLNDRRRQCCARWNAWQLDCWNACVALTNNFHLMLNAQCSLHNQFKLFQNDRDFVFDHTKAACKTHTTSIHNGKAIYKLRKSMWINFCPLLSDLGWSGVKMNLTIHAVRIWKSNESCLRLYLFISSNWNCFEHW